MHVNTSQLRKGDIVHCHGLDCLIDQDIKTYPGQGGKVVFNTSAKVINLDECKKNGTLYWKDGEVFHDGVIPLSWLYPDVFRGGWAKDWDADPRWVIQGNDFAMWQITRKDEANEDAG